MRVLDTDAVDAAPAGEWLDHRYLVGKTAVGYGDTRRRARAVNRLFPPADRSAQVCAG
jgi:hypothetical protein